MPLGEQITHKVHLLCVINQAGHQSLIYQEPVINGQQIFGDSCDEKWPHTVLNIRMRQLRNLTLFLCVNRRLLSLLIWSFGWYSSLSALCAERATKRRQCLCLLLFLSITKSTCVFNDCEMHHCPLNPELSCGFGCRLDNHLQLTILLVLLRCSWRSTWNRASYVSLSLVAFNKAYLHCPRQLRENLLSKTPDCALWLHTSYF